jgi:hypothetical protein
MEQIKCLFKEKVIYKIMEILRIGLIAFILFYFNWIQILGMIAFLGLVYYYKSNKNLLIENSNYFNFVFYYLITCYEISYFYGRKGYEKFKNNCIGKYIHNYLEYVNNKYLQLRNYFINKLFNLTIQTAIKTMMMIEKKEKPKTPTLTLKFKKNKVSTKKLNINEFLDNLEK